MAYLINGRWEKEYSDEITPAYPTMFNKPDDLSEYSFTPYLKYYGNGWYEVDHSAPDYAKEEYENYFLEQKSFLQKG
ncbi:hypothetical protein SAMN04487770_12025 [Butyrivibrio sp. ob235]|uniref:hypothetical protein n=1 Tax=Butyrivibrio sp. ob235 TaxID=1761780 RepID=UPI0008B698F3|nr:hypothetical protein [Butyrivibrio sp. ob235]SEL89622.1 hypothetical protein SAMN04487770_12025 [Butyrivibrio sp. ob235]